MLLGFRLKHGETIWRFRMEMKFSQLEDAPLRLGGWVVFMNIICNAESKGKRKWKEVLRLAIIFRQIREPWEEDYRLVDLGRRGFVVDEYLEMVIQVRQLWLNPGKVTLVTYG